MCLFIVLLRCKKHLSIEPAGNNPFATVYQVLKYSWKHKVPERRSAFTYWEEDIPRRIDLGKNKYGGPFTTEEVEDTKSFFSILLLLLSLFGFHLSGNGFTIYTSIHKKSMSLSMARATGHSQSSIAGDHHCSSLHWPV